MVVHRVVIQCQKIKISASKQAFLKASGAFMGNSCCKRRGLECDDEEKRDCNGECKEERHCDVEEERECDPEKRRFLEELLEVRKVDVQNPEITDMLFAVKERFVNAVGHLKGTELEVVDIILCGSMAEGTRVWEYERLFAPVPVIEFDFLAVLNAPVIGAIDRAGNNFCVGNGQCRGYKTIGRRLERPSGYSSIYKSEVVSPSKLRRALRDEVLKYMTCYNDDSRLIFSTFPVMYSSDGSNSIQYRFLWTPFGLGTTPYVRSPAEGHGVCLINVDFMPAFRFQSTEKNGTPCYLVAKSPCSHTCFLQSYCRQEIQAVLETSQIHRDVYMLLKTFKDIDKDETPTYFFKTAVLQHVKKCSNPDLVVCLSNVMQDLSHAYSKREFLTLYGEINLLSYSTSERFNYYPNKVKRFFSRMSDSTIT